MCPRSRSLEECRQGERSDSNLRDRLEACPTPATRCIYPIEGPTQIPKSSLSMFSFVKRTGSAMMTVFASCLLREIFP